MDLKRWLITARYLATLPIRRFRNARMAGQGRAPIMVLFYHRVADDHPNGWTISRSLFQQQVEWLSKHTDVVSLSEAQERLRSGHNSRPTTCITFDDGYADNCEFALPYLIANQVPCTYFVASQNMLKQRPFPHDVAAGVDLAPNTPEQIAQLAAEGVEIGAHTRTHCDLGGIDNPRQLYDEIVGSGDELADVTRRPIRYFAFPYGQLHNMSDAAMRIAEEAGYQGVCSAFGGYNFPGQPDFFLRRIHGDPDMARFKNWLTFDPRKHALHCDFPYPPRETDGLGEGALVREGQ